MINVKSREAVVFQEPHGRGLLAADVRGGLAAAAPSRGLDVAGLVFALYLWLVLRPPWNVLLPRPRRRPLHPSLPRPSVPKWRVRSLTCVVTLFTAGPARARDGFWSALASRPLASRRSWWRPTGPSMGTRRIDSKD